MISELRGSRVWWLLAAGVTCLCLALWGTQERTAALPDESSPDVIVLMTDDMRADDLSVMPHTRALFDRYGTTFTDTSSTYPLCCPARAVMLSGQYNHNNGVQSNVPPRGGMGAYDHTSSIATSLADAGYASAFIGKFLNGYHDIKDDWTHPPGWTTFLASLKPGIYDYWRPRLIVDESPRVYPRTYTTAVTDRWMRRMSQVWGREDEPYFIWASYLAPHSQCAPAYRMIRTNSGCWGMPSAPRRDIDATLDEPSLDSPAINERDVSDKGRLLRERRLRRAPGLYRLDRLHHQRLASLRSVDRSVARLVRHLRRTGAMDHTYVVFTSDNGHLIGEHRWLGKVLGYEESVRVPLLVMGPGVPHGLRVHEPVALVDLPRTIMQWTGAEPPRTPDGISLTSVIHRAEAGRSRDRVLPIEAGPNDGKGDGWLYRGVRSKRWTYFRWGDGFEELYDRRSDPYQLRSVAHDRAYAAVLRWARRETEQLGDCAGSDCVAWYDGPRLPVPPASS